MSWNSYIENLISSSHVQKAAIYGLDGSKWAASEGFEVSKEEFDAIKAGFNDTKNFSMSGMRVGQTKFFFLSGSDDILRGKKETTGVHVAKTEQAIIIGYYDQASTSNLCATQVDCMADHLKKSGY
uniref:Profilin n=2 Tax=Portunus trituberculatus TaxID=210409 RepID=D2XTC1_PORTR|nr:profilin [Portunus trituberculatus]